MKVGVEGGSSERLPHMLLPHFGEAIEVVREGDHPADRLIVDYAHGQAMDGDIPGHLDAGWDLIELIQLADHPGRVEPGAGELNFIRLIDALVERGFTGPCALEHLWSVPGAQGQAAYLEWPGRWVAPAGRDKRS